MRVLAICVVWLTVFLAPALAETRVALIVANAAYADAPLPNPTVDGGLVAQSLKQVGFDVTVVNNASLATFDASVKAFAEKAKSADMALFYYAGHGFALPDRGVMRNYLMASDAQITSTSDTVLRAGGMGLDEVIDTISENAKVTLVFVDACRNDPRVSRSVGGRGRGLAQIPTAVGESVFVGLSTRAGDVAADGTAGQGSPFARAFAAKIGAPGERLDDAFTQVRLQVEKETDRVQRPDIGRDDLSAPIYLNGSSGGAPAQTVAAASGGSSPAADCDRLTSQATVPFAAIDAPVAIHACRAAVQAAPDDATQMFQLGRALDKGLQYPEAREWYTKAAALNHSGAMSNLGTMFEEGQGGPKDQVKAVELYEAAAAQGNVLAMGNVALMAYWGRGGPQDHAKAREFYGKAADKGDAGATTALGQMLMRGEGGAQDLAKARQLFETASALGDTRAMSNLASMYDLAIGGPQDYAKARELYEKAAADNMPSAANNLAVLYQKGQGGPEDLAKAREYYIKAVSLGHTAAMRNLAAMYDVGAGGQKDRLEAAKLIETALRKGEAPVLAEMQQKSSQWSPEFRQALQRRLSDAGVYKGSVDGKFGPGVLKAIQAIYGKDA